MPEPREKAGAAQKETPAAAPEKPSPTSEAAATDEQEWIITFKPAQGTIVKVEKLEKDTGQRQELSKEEYGALAVLGLPVPADKFMPAMQEGAMAAAEGTDPYQAAYYQGLTDYATALNTLAPAAYYQALSDYAAAAADPTAAAVAYYQGMIDAASL
jgi:hypothetical protein